MDKMEWIQQLLLGQLPEAIYFAWFLILTKKLNNKRILFTIIMIAEYLLLKQVFIFNIWFQVSYVIMTYLTLKLLYKERAQITDVFTFGIASLYLIITSAISFICFRPNMLLVSISNRIILFISLILFRNKLYNIQKLYKGLWNRNDKIKKKMKSTTFRALNLVIFNLMFYVLNLGMLYMLYLRR